MGKDSSRRVNWEPDLSKGSDIVRNLKDIKKELKEDADKRKIDGFNPRDLMLPK